MLIIKKSIICYFQYWITALSTFNICLNSITDVLNRLLYLPIKLLSLSNAQSHGKAENTVCRESKSR